jgi:hypothetical protein
MACVHKNKICAVFLKAMVTVLSATVDMSLLRFVILLKVIATDLILKKCTQKITIAVIVW